MTGYADGVRFTKTPFTNHNLKGERQMTDNFDEITTVGESWDTYTPPTDTVPQPDAGIYNLVRNTDEGSFRAYHGEYDGNKYVMYNFKANLVGAGVFDGRYVSASASTFISKYSGTSTVEDFIHSAGAAGTIFKTRPSVELLFAEAEQAETDFPDNKPYRLEQVVGPFTAKVDWEWRCRDCEETFLAGQRQPKAPKKYNGPKAVVKKNGHGTELVQNCPTCNAGVGAQLVVKKFLSTKTNGAGGHAAATSETGA